MFSRTISFSLSFLFLFTDREQNLAKKGVTRTAAEDASSGSDFDAPTDVDEVEEEEEDTDDEIERYLPPLSPTVTASAFAHLFLCGGGRITQARLWGVSRNCATSINTPST